MADERFIDAPPEGADGWRDVWREDRQYRQGPSPVAQAFRRLVRRASAPDAERQKNFNLVVLDLLADIRRDQDAIRSDLRGDIEAVQRDMQTADAALSAEVAHLRDLIPVAAMRNDALIAALDQKIETLAVRLRDAI